MRPLPGELRPTSLEDVVAILCSLSVPDQVRVRAEAKRAIERWKDDGEVTVYNGLRYRIPARAAKAVLDRWRAERGWVSLGEAARIEERNHGERGER